MTRYSLVVPVFNSLPHLAQVFSPFSQLGPAWEIIAVDDGSTDGSARWLREHYPWVRVIQQRNQGQALARNRGVSVSQGEILFFVDSDVVVDPGTLQRMARWMEEHPQYDGVFGCYSSWGYRDEKPLSRFRNLLHRIVHREQKGLVASFWTGLGALRKEAFLLAGGFDSRLTGIEDVGLGKRLSDLGRKIILNSEFEGRHLKRWTWSSMIRTDIFIRAKPWTYYGFLGLTPQNMLNLAPRNALPPIFLMLALGSCLWLPQLSVGFLLLYLSLNTPRYRYFAASAGLLFGLQSISYLFVHHLCCLIGAGLGTAQAVGHHLIQKPGEIHRLPTSQQESDLGPISDGDGFQGALQQMQQTEMEANIVPHTP